MTRRTAHLGSGLLLSAALALGCATGGTNESDEAYPEGRPEGWEEAARTARLNGESVAGRGFARALHNAYGRTREDVLLLCGIRIPDERSTRILFRFGADGKVAESLAYPTSAYSECVVDGLLELEQPVPPEPDY